MSDASMVDQNLIAIQKSNPNDPERDAIVVVAIKPILICYAPSFVVILDNEY